MRRAAEVLVAMGARNVLMKGGHLKGDALDLLYLESGEVREFSAPRHRDASHPRHRMHVLGGDYRRTGKAHQPGRGSFAGEGVRH